MNTLEKNRTSDDPNTPTRLYNPWDLFSRNDFLDFWEGNKVDETIPSVHVSETKDRYKLVMDAPGLNKEDFNIYIDGNVMTVSYEKESEAGRDGERYSHSEYSYSSFSRSFTIPDHSDTNRIVAKYTDGVLSLNIPKRSEPAKTKNKQIIVK